MSSFGKAYRHTAAQRLDQAVKLQGTSTVGGVEVTFETVVPAGCVQTARVLLSLASPTTSPRIAHAGIPWLVEYVMVCNAGVIRKLRLSRLRCLRHQPRMCLLPACAIL